MNDIDIIIAFYDTIKDSMEWATVAENKKYGSYVDGVVAMTEKMLERYNESPVDDYNKIHAVMD